MLPQLGFVSLRRLYGGQVLLAEDVLLALGCFVSRTRPFLRFSLLRFASGVSYQSESGVFQTRFAAGYHDQFRNACTRKPGSLLGTPCQT